MSKSRVAIVTGGSRGIGAAIVASLHRDGWSILLTHSSESGDGAKLADDLNGIGNCVVQALRVDVNEENAPQRIFEHAGNLGEVTALVNNAGITGPLGPVDALDDHVLERVMATNVTAPIRLSREALRVWGEPDEPRHIVNISSIAASTGSPGEYVAYAASKAALETFTIGLAKEVGPIGVLVNAVSPGTIRTGIHERAGEPGRAERVGKKVPLRRPGEAGEVAEAVRWLLSGAATYVTGSVLSVTGGL